MKFYRSDAIAFVVALLVMATVIAIMPTHVLPLLRGAIGFTVALLLFGGYLVLRKPDVVLEMEESLHRSAQHAAAIASIARERRAAQAKIRDRLLEISQRIAHVATKCFTRDLAGIQVHVQRLERVAGNFETVLGVLTGEVTMKTDEMATAITQIEDEKVPGVLEALSDIEVAIDEVQARRWQAAESDLEVLTHLAELSSKAGQAAQLLKQIISSEGEV
jgi:hypothetical protein